MSLKSTLLAIGVVVAALAASHFFTYKTAYSSGYNDAVNSIVQDSVEVIITDTVFVAEYFPVYLDWEREADIDTADNIITYSTHIDTTVIIDQDTVVTVSQDISFTEGIFNILMKIETRPIEIIKTKIIHSTIPVPVPSDPPFYNTFVFGSVFATIALLLVALLL